MARVHRVVRVPAQELVYPVVQALSLRLVSRDVVRGHADVVRQKSVPCEKRVLLHIDIKRPWRHLTHGHVAATRRACVGCHSSGLRADWLNVHIRSDPTRRRLRSLTSTQTHK